MGEKSLRESANSKHVKLKFLKKQRRRKNDKRKKNIIRIDKSII